MPAQQYELRESWTVDEFPGTADIGDVQTYNQLMPSGYKLHIVPVGSEVRVELYAYTGEAITGDGDA
jgi:hypothetical protein